MNADPRAELARIAHDLRRLVAAERAAGVVSLPGRPPPTPPPTANVPPEKPAPPPATPLPGPPQPATPQPATPQPATPQHGPRTDRSRPPRFRPKVGPLDLPPDALTPFGDLPARVDACVNCFELCEARTTTVFGEGDPTADLVFCGEAPGFEEDKSGRPFVGAAGVLLTRMIVGGLEMRREDVFVLNALKCRPPGNRTPSPREIESCRPFLEQQLAVIRPKVIVALGNPACKALLGDVGGITRIRGRVFRAFGCSVVPTFHPAYLLRNPAAKRDAWEDLKLALRLVREP